MENKIETLNLELNELNQQITKLVEDMEGYQVVIKAHQEILHRIASKYENKKHERFILEHSIAMEKCPYKVGDVFQADIPFFSHLRIEKIMVKPIGYIFITKYKSKDTKRWCKGGTWSQEMLESFFVK